MCSRRHLLLPTTEYRQVGMASYAEKENETSWWDNAPMPPTGTRIKELIVDFIEQLDKINDNEDSTGLIFLALVN